MITRTFENNVLLHNFTGCVMCFVIRSLRHDEMRCKAMKDYAVKALIDTSSTVNFISKNLAGKIRIKYTKHRKYTFGKN